MIEIEDDDLIALAVSSVRIMEAYMGLHKAIAEQCNLIEAICGVEIIEEDSPPRPSLRLVPRDRTGPEADPTPPPSDSPHSDPPA